MLKKQQQQQQQQNKHAAKGAAAYQTPVGAFRLGDWLVTLTVSIHAPVAARNLLLTSLRCALRPSYPPRYQLVGGEGWLFHRYDRTSSNDGGERGTQGVGGGGGGGGGSGVSNSRGSGSNGKGGVFRTLRIVATNTSSQTLHRTAAELAHGRWLAPPPLTILPYATVSWLIAPSLLDETEGNCGRGWSSSSPPLRERGDPAVMSSTRLRKEKDRVEGVVVYAAFRVKAESESDGGGDDAFGTRRPRVTHGHTVLLTPRIYVDDDLGRQARWGSAQAARFEERAHDLSTSRKRAADVEYCARRWRWRLISGSDAAGSTDSGGGGVQNRGVMAEGEGCGGVEALPDGSGVAFILAAGGRGIDAVAPSDDATALEPTFELPPRSELQLERGQHTATGDETRLHEVRLVLLPRRTKVEAEGSSHATVDGVAGEHQGSASASVKPTAPNDSDTVDRR